MGLEETLEPEDDGLVISLAYDRFENDRVFENGKLLLWYIGRPRRIGYTDDTYIHHPFNHQDKILVLTGPDHLEGISSNDQALKECWTGKTVYKNWPPINRAISFKGEIYASREAGERPVINEELPHGGYYPSWLIKITEKGIEPAFGLDTIVLDLASNGKTLFILEVVPKPLGDGEYAVSGWEGRDNTNEFNINSSSYPRSIIATENTVLIGGVGSIKEWNIEKNEHRDHLPNEQAAVLYRKCYDAWKKHEDLEEDKCLETARELGYKGWEDISEISYFLAHNFTVSHMIKFHGQTLYSIKNKLYALGQPKPVWTFRQPITGLTTLNYDALKEVKGKASVRKGQRKSMSQSKPAAHAVRIAA